MTIADIIAEEIVLRKTDDATKMTTGRLDDKRIEPMPSMMIEETETITIVTITTTTTSILLAKVN
jgi:hypothetical protein